MTKQTWTAAVAAVLFVVFAAVIAIAPVPYVAFAPGRTTDLLPRDGVEAPITVTGITSHASRGRLLMTTAAVTRPDDTLSLLEALFAYWSADREVFPRDSVYPVGADPTPIRQDEVQAMDTSKADAAVSGLREADVSVTQMPMVVTVATQGPAFDKVQPGDFVVGVDGKAVSTAQDIRDAIARHTIGEAVILEVQRDGKRYPVTIETAASKTQSGVPVIGVTFGIGFVYAPKVSINVDPTIGGPSAGLMFALTVYEIVSADDLTAGRVIAGTGDIDGLGEVHPVGGAHEKLAAARRDGANIFLVPAENCADLGAIPSDVRVVPVASINEAVTSLEALRNPADAEKVKVCP